MQAEGHEKNLTRTAQPGGRWFFVLVATGTAIVLAAWFSSALKSQFLAWDFPQFYTSARLPVRLIYITKAHSALSDCAIWRRWGFVISRPMLLDLRCLRYCTGPSHCSRTGPRLRFGLGYAFAPT